MRDVPYHWRSKPPFGSRIDPGHPLAQGVIGSWLVNEGAGKKVLDLSGNGNHLGVDNQGVYGTSSVGPGLYCAGGIGDAGAVSTTPSKALQPATSVTLVWSGAILGGGSSNCLVAGMAYDSVSPFMCYALGRFNISTGLVWWTSNGGTFNAVQVVNPITNGKLVHVVLTAIPGSQIFYLNGSAVGSGSIAGNLVYSAAPQFGFGNYFNTGRDTNSFTLSCTVYNRPLSASEAAWLYAEPYAMIAPPSVRRFVSYGRNTNLFRSRIFHSQIVRGK